MSAPMGTVDMETGEYMPASQVSGQLLVKDGCFKSASLDLPEDLEYSEWQEIGSVIQRAEKAVMWWIGDWLAYGEKQYGETFAKAAELTSYQIQTLKDAKWVAQRVEKSRRRDFLSWSHHKEVAALSPREQDKWLDTAERKQLSMHNLRREIRQAQHQIEAPAQMTGTYRVIYADPPWSYGDKRHDFEGKYTGAEHHYPSMSIAEMCALPVRDIVQDDAVLFMWVTSPLLYEAAPIIDAWGFQYKACFVWDKVAHNVGYYNSVRHEFLLICTRGRCTPDVPKLHDSVIDIKRPEKHSEKPEFFRDLIDAMYPHGERIELFRRGEAPNGWNVWGNQSDAA